jgi:hypothetical protein
MIYAYPLSFQFSILVINPCIRIVMYEWLKICKIVNERLNLLSYYKYDTFLYLSKIKFSHLDVGLFKVCMTLSCLKIDKTPCRLPTTCYIIHSSSRIYKRTIWHDVIDQIWDLWSLSDDLLTLIVINIL